MHHELLFANILNLFQKALRKTVFVLFELLHTYLLSMWGFC